MSFSNNPPLSCNLRNICVFSGFETTQQLGGKLTRNNPLLHEVGWIGFRCVKTHHLGGSSYCLYDEMLECKPSKFSLWFLQWRGAGQVQVIKFCPCKVLPGFSCSRYLYSHPLLHLLCLALVITADRQVTQMGVWCLVSHSSWQDSVASSFMKCAKTWKFAIYGSIYSRQLLQHLGWVTTFISKQK